jgi:hypothetical protein
LCCASFRYTGHFLGVAASWLVQVGIEIYRFFSSIFKDGSDDLDKEERVKILGKRSLVLL